MDPTTALALLLTLLLGAALGWFAHGARTAERLATAEARVRGREEGEADLRRSLELLGADAARRQSGEVGAQVAGVVGPLREAVGSLAEHLDRVERVRGEAYAGLSEQVAGMHRTSEALTTQTSRLVTALRAPQVRGRWGELQLQRVVELAGMTEHCDFTTQADGHVDRGDTTARVRPDMVVHLAGGRTVVLDAKVPFQAFLDAVDAPDERTRTTLLASHARALRAHVDQLAGKTYWRAQADTPEFVVLFVPGDPFLEAALRAEPGLLEHAFARNVVITTPTTLVALLRTVAHTWRQDTLHRDAAAVLELGRELQTRVATVGGHLDRLGGQLGRAVEAYNATLGSLESRVLVTARKLGDLGLGGPAVPEPEQVETRPRRVQAAGLLPDGAPPPWAAAAADEHPRQDDRRAG
ncbi:DNA recombination protein RmuC [Rhodococcus aerolatus]